MQLLQPHFLDFEPAYYAHEAEDAGLVRGPLQSDDGPLWCICTQCSRKQLKKVCVVEHTPSGIYVVVGGTCSFHMVGMRDYADVEVATNGENPLAVRMLLGVDH